MRGTFAAWDAITGVPRAALEELITLESAQFEIWEMTSGAISDSAADEVFIVLQDAATLCVDKSNGERFIDCNPAHRAPDRRSVDTMCRR